MSEISAVPDSNYLTFEYLDWKYGPPLGDTGEKNDWKSAVGIELTLYEDSGFDTYVSWLEG